MKILALAALCLTSSTTQILAAECQRAAPPPCVTAAGNFASNKAADSCNAEVKEYFESVRLFSQCKRQEILEINEANRNEMLAVNEEVRKTTRLFRCRMRSDADCN